MNGHPFGAGECGTTKNNPPVLIRYWWSEVKGNIIPI